jgi:tRNA/tmRNA/rRNA uracil-C5-methylase (TrmA/RlmC/RlmD family)
MESFFQGNLFILPEVMKQLRALNVWDKRGVFFDLYGGVGLFGVCLGDLVDKVVLIEENQVAMSIARHNAIYNKVDNFEVHGGRVEEVLPKLIEAYQGLHKVVMVDPPRAGLSRTAIELLNSLKSVDHLFYLSCHPNSLKVDLGNLSPSWQVERIIPFDFFPKTKHVETFVLLKQL